MRAAGGSSRCRASRRSRASRSSRSAPARCPAFCVDVKPRKSSDVSGIRSAPGMPAATAICFGSDCSPSKPPPAKPRRIDVSVEELRSREERFVASSMWSRVSVRSRIATSFDSSRVSVGIAREAAARRSSTGLPARRSCGRWRARRVGDEPVEVRAVPRRPSRRARPATARSRASSPASVLLELALRVARGRRGRRSTCAVRISWCSGGTSTSTSFDCDDADAVEQVLLRAARRRPSARCGEPTARAGRRARRSRPRRRRRRRRRRGPASA